MKSGIRLLTTALMLFAFACLPLQADVKVVKGKDYQIKLDSENITFILKREGKTAAVPGYFNTWNPKDEKSQMVKKDGVFTLVVPLSRFTLKKPFEFKFYVDGNWDQGNNKAVNLKKKKGEWWIAKSPVDEVKSNTPLNASIMFGGHFTSWIPFKQDVKAAWNVDGDDGFYITDSEHNFDLDMNYKIGGSVLGFARLKINYRETSDRRMWLDSLGTHFISDDMKITAFYKKRISSMNFDDPLQSLRKFVSTDYTGITFTGQKSKTDLYDFGRNYGGMNFYFEPIFNTRLLLARKIEGTTGVQQDIIAARVKPLNTKLLTVGVTWLYNANRDWDDEAESEVNNGGKYVNPLAYNYFARPFNTTKFYSRISSTNTNATTANGTVDSSYNHEIGVDVVAHIGPLTAYAQGKFYRAQYDVTRTLEGDEVTFTDKNSILAAGVVFSSGSLVVEGSYMMFNIKEAYAVSSSNTTPISTKANYLTLKGMFSFGKNSYVAASFILKNQDKGDPIWEQRAEARFETSFFDLWAFQSLRTLQGRTEALTYTYFEAKAGIDWYFSSKFTATLGVRFVNDMLEDGGVSRASYFSVVPLVGLKYKFTKNITARLYYGSDLDYTSYLEDNNRTVEASAVWASSADSLTSSRNDEKKLMNMPSVTFMADVKF